MMKKGIIRRPEKIVPSDPIYYYLSAISGIVVLYIAFGSYAQVLYENYLIIPCLLFLGALLERRAGLKNRKYLALPVMMMTWFLILQIKRGIEHADLDNTGLFLVTYLFAFPLASLLQDRDKKRALKMFAGAYFTAASILSVDSLLLILDCLPAFLTEHVCWTGARLEPFWHPNIAACFFMIGVVFGTTFFSQAKLQRSKIGLGVLLILIVAALALTNCRTAIILTGSYLGAILFFGMVSRGKKWFLPGVLAAAVLAAAFYVGSGYLYQANHKLLLEKYAQQYSAQLMPERETVEEIPSEEGTDPAIIEPEPGSEQEALERLRKNIASEETCSEETYSKEEYAEEDQEEVTVDLPEETIPISVDSETGEIHLTTDSPQGSLSEDFGSLNSRTYIWSAARFAIRETPSILLWGMHNPGWYVSFYFFKPIGHLHNAWLQCLVGMGVVGFLIAMLFTLLTLWNCLTILLKHHQDLWKRNVALLAVCLLVASVLEPYLFYTTVEYHLTDFLFFLCAGYLACWQEEENRHLLAILRRRMPFLR